MKSIKVWDIFVRFFHWALVVAVIVQLATAEDFKDVHVKVGYFIIALLAARIIWGFVGSRHARFSDFVYSPREILAYLKGLLRRQSAHYSGHNPAGGAMVCALLFFLVLTALSGLAAHNAHGKGAAGLPQGSAVSRAWAHDTEQEREHGDQYYGKGQAAPMGAASQAHFWKEIHETLVGIIIFLVILHFCGVLASSYIHRENLIMAMITGKKKIP